MTGLFQFSMVSSSAIHVVRVLFLFNLLIHIYLLSSPSEYIYHILFICLSVNQHLGCFYLLGYCE